MNITQKKMNDKHLIQNPLFEEIKDYFETTIESKETIFIFVPFIKTDILKKLLPNIDSPVVIVTTWNTTDLLSGSSELELYPYCKERKISLYVNNKIHLKAYSVDLKTMILATGNISRKGLLPEGNYELGVFVTDLSAKDRLYLEKIRTESILINDKIYEKFLRWFKIQEKPKKIPNEFENIIQVTEITNFLISALPMTRNVDILIKAYSNLNNGKSPSDDEEITACVYHDLAKYNIELGLTQSEFLTKLKKQFFNHSFIQKIDEFIAPEAYFGRVKEWIQNNCTDVPIPSRRELTGNVQVLYEWFEKLGDGKYVIDVPGSHSQRITNTKF